MMGVNDLPGLVVAIRPPEDQSLPFCRQCRSSHGFTPWEDDHVGKEFFTFALNFT
jgi:hypothetical protein